MKPRHLLILCGALFWATSVSAATITIGGGADPNITTDVKDNTIFKSNVNNSDGGGPGMFAGTNANSAPSRGLIEFNISGNIPAEATITSVQLQLFLGMAAGAAGRSYGIGLHDVSAPWGEGTAGSGNSGIGGTGQGFPAGTGDATWNASQYPSTLWTNPGGDYSATASATTSVGTTLNVASTWGSTAALVADVQGWLNNPATNFGWAVVSADETDSQTARAFWTREAGTATLRPELIVNYTPAPEPSTLALLACAAFPLWAAVRFGAH